MSVFAARQPRTAPGGYVYHALNRSVARLPLFQKDVDYDAFGEKKRGRGPFSSHFFPFFGRPGFRKVYSRPKPLAVRFCQCSDPNGWLRSTERRTASNSASVSA